MQTEPDAALAPAEIAQALGRSRMASLFETREPELATAYLERVYGPHALQLAGSAELSMRLRGCEFAQLHLGEIRYGSPAVAAMSKAHGHWVFSYLRRGRVVRDDGIETGPGDAGVMAPECIDQLVMSADMELLNLRVAPHDMDAACQVLLGSDLAHPLRFAEHADAGAPAVAAFLRVMGHLAATPPYPHQAAGRLEQSLRDAALFELLLAWPNSYTGCFDPQAALPVSTRRARDYIHAHAAANPGVADIARAAGVGVRALARGFEKHLGVSPQRYLLQYRLDRVRERLLAASTATVTEVATEFGFWQLGQFAARYRGRFGESPSQTLRRTRV